MKRKNTRLRRQTEDSNSDQRDFLLFVIGFVLLLLSMYQCQTAEELRAIRYVLECKL
jgi:hypothetical protein